MGDGGDEHLVEPPERVALQELAVVGAIGEDAGVVEGHVRWFSQNSVITSSTCRWE